MFKITDKIRARYLLEVRQQGGHTFAHFIRANKVRYLFLVVVLGGISTAFALNGDWASSVIVASYIFGVVVSNLSWLLAMKKSWPFMSRALNWDEVKKVHDDYPARTA